MAGGELVADPAVDTALWRLPAGSAPQRGLAETDGQQAWVDAEHGYAVRAYLFGEGLGQLHQRRLRGCVGRHQRPPVDARVAGDVDDPALGRRDHVRKRQLGQDECTAEVHFDGLPPFGRSGLPGRPGRPADAGVIDENVYGSQPPAQLGDGGGCGPLVGDVRAGGSGDAARPVDLAHRGRQFTGGAGDEPDGRSGIGQPGTQ